MSVERLGAGTYVFGPTARGQGLLAPILEDGSRNNPAHNDVHQAADIVEYELPNRVARDLGDYLDETLR